MDAMDANHEILRYDRLAFFINGLVNNFTYVLFLSAAVDLVHGGQKGNDGKGASATEISEGAVLLADILPGLLVKLICPYVMHRLSYGCVLF